VLFRRPPGEAKRTQAARSGAVKDGPQDRPARGCLDSAERRPTLDFRGAAGVGEMEKVAVAGDWPLAADREVAPAPTR
jgi:hypothetical protein